MHSRRGFFARFFGMAATPLVVPEVKVEDVKPKMVEESWYASGQIRSIYLHSVPLSRELYRNGCNWSGAVRGDF